MADSIIGALRVNLGLDSGEFYEGLELATGVAKKFAWGLAGTFTAAGAAAAGLVFATEGVRQKIKELDDLQRDSSLPIEELQRMDFAARVLDGSVGDLVKGMKTLRDNLEMVGDDDSKLKKALDLIDVSLKNNNGTMKTTKEIFDEVLNKLSQYRDGANKTAIANAVFGDSADSLIKMTQDGTAQLEKYKEEAEALGLVLGGEATQATLHYIDTMKRLGIAKDGLLGKINEALMPALTTMVDKFYELAKSGNDYTAISKGIDVGVRAIAAGFVVLSGVVSGFLSFLGSASSALYKFFSGDFAGAMADAKSAVVQPLNIVLGDTIGVIDKLFKKGDEAPARIGKFSEAMRQMQRGLRENAPKMDEDDKKMEGKWARWEETVRKRIAALKEERAIIGLGTAEKERSNLTLEFESFLRKNNIQLTKEERAERMKLIETAYQEAKATEQLKMAWASFWEGMDIFKNAISSAFDKLMDGTFKLKDALRDLVKQFAKMAINKAFLSIFGSSTQPGAFNFASLFGLGGGKSGGGDVNTGMVYPVGENGPELFAPRVPGQIISNQSVKAMSNGNGGGPMVVNINAPGADAAALARVQAEVRTLDATLERRAYSSQRTNSLRGTRPRSGN